MGRSSQKDVRYKICDLALLLPSKYIFVSLKSEIINPNYKA